MKRPHKFIEDIATDDEWNAIVTRLEALSFDQVRALSARLGLEFADPSGVTKDDYINILDEAYWDEFEHELDRLIGA